MLVREWKKLLINFKANKFFWTDVYNMYQAKANGFTMRNSVNDRMFFPLTFCILEG